MSAEALSVADDMLHSFFERWQRLEEEKQALSDDLKELFAEMKGVGFDTKAARAVFREENKLANEDAADKADRTEFEAMCELYRASLRRPRAGRARSAREIIEKFPPASERKTAGHAPREMGGKDANTGGSDVDSSASARPSGQTLGAEPHSVERGIADFENVERNTSGPDAKRAPIHEPAPPPPGAETAGDLSAPAFVAGPVSPSATVPLADTAPEPDAPPPVIGSGAPVLPSELCAPGDAEVTTAMAALAADKSAVPIPPFVPAFLHKDHEPTNPNCQKPATCKWARSMASCSACAQAAFKARAA